MRYCAKFVTCVLLLAGSGFAQSPCPTTSVSNKMICLIPQLFGPAGLVLPSIGHEAHFSSAFQNNFTPMNTAIGSQLTNLPLASPAAGIVYTFDPSLGVATREASSLGPILSERGETLGKRRLYLAFTYQYFSFDKIDGAALNRIPAVFQHEDVLGIGVGEGVLGDPSFERDVIDTLNDVRLRVHQSTFFVSYGLTDRVDVSVAIPIMSVRMDVTSNATIVTNTNTVFHAFEGGASNKTFRAQRSATGVGDVTFRVKGTAYRGERHSVAAGLDVRTPTGDEENFLGSGTVGVKPFMAWSYGARVSPHVNIGYEWNGDSLLGGDPLTGTKGSLPNQFFYTIGADAALSSNVTVSFDLLGQALTNARQVQVTPFTDLGNSAGVRRTYDNISFSAPGTYSVVNGAVGFKARPTANLLVSGNLILKLNDGGLRSKVIPMVGLSYTF
jgi:hypothetical protein